MANYWGSAEADVITPTSGFHTAEQTDDPFGSAPKHWVFDNLYGYAGNDFLDGGWGGDFMSGGDGNDEYNVDSLDDVVYEADDHALAGVDTVFSTVSYILHMHLENLTLEGSANSNATGNAKNNFLTGNFAANRLLGHGGDDTLDGSWGGDYMNGGAGNDIYLVDNVSDIVSETYDDSSSGVDRVISRVTYTLDAYVENLILHGSAHISATGNAKDNVLLGNIGDNILNGLGGADTMAGDGGNDTYYIDNVGDSISEDTDIHNLGSDHVFSTVSHALGVGFESLTLEGTTAINAKGNSQYNSLIGNAGANILNGLAGGDYMNGFAGNDTYYVDNKDDAVYEFFDDATAGVDRVLSTISYTLDTMIENLRLTGTADINATGNAKNNTLVGNSGTNVLDGLAGNDTYILATSGDTVVETLGAGIDQVNAGYSYTLTAHFENLLLTGAANLNGTGNSLANRLVGNDGTNTLLGLGSSDTLLGGGGNDRLDGGEGADRLEGGVGNDIYILASSGDTVVEAASAGADELRAAFSVTLGAHVERLLLTGTANLNGTGNSVANVLTGNSGANTLWGGGGADTLAGGGGQDLLDGGADGSVRDLFVFSDRSHSRIGAGCDTIENFVLGSDDIDLRRMDANASTAGTNEDFIWGGQTAGAQKVWWQAATGGVILRADVTGDITADFELFLRGPGALGQGDVLL